ncbi:MAG: purine-nucleoside phosphorylase [Deltaproteobacteria bacterium]|nr:purine-nucleoside phosphorylase [Deltaproteobacteria bacterium]
MAQRRDEGARARDPLAAEVAAGLGAGWRGAEVAVILGSGLGCAAEGSELHLELGFGEVTGLAGPRITGHEGRLLRGRLAGTEVLWFVGRRHVYEGLTAAEAALPARIAAALGAKCLLCLSAVGAADPRHATGSWVFVEDHLNLMGRNPLEGVSGEDGPAFLDLTAAYRADLYDPVASGLRRRGVETARGVLAAFAGPSYETPAEVRMARLLGATVVGMSTVPEAVWARYLGLDVLAWGRVANPAAGLSPAPLKHSDVVERMAERPEEAKAVVEESILAWKR